MDKTSTTSYVRSVRGATLLLFNKFIYRLQCRASKDGHKTWYCVMYGKIQCPSILTTNVKDHIIQIRGQHNHSRPNIKHTAAGLEYKHLKENPYKKTTKDLAVEECESEVVEILP
ncbi:hypothetical protein MSG28_008222 [Choristoneura fumiferana]|uniref:Uncharacterized protein n=1 Tax=Choristoneura fumiferana TaxID=7141 RepID=A0ACC0JAH2_CHOFU|nr:hypothetical protein MSG28_008222 [Choristoneura fumiferana]